MSPQPDSLQAWLDGARDIGVPFGLPLADPEGSELACEAVLRVLPGRRLVLRATWQGRPVLAKLFAADARMPQRVQREAAGVAALQAAGIATPALLAQGMSRCGRAGVVLLAWLDGALPLGEAWGDPARRGHWLAELGSLLAALHDAGLCQHDPHRDNFLCVGDRLWLIDAATVEHRVAPLPEQASLQNLALLLAQWPLAEQPAVQALVDHYTALRRLPLQAQAFEARVQHAWRRRTQQFLAKTLRECTQFAVRTQRGAFAAWERAADGPGLQRFLADPDAVMAQGRVLKAGNSATVVRLELDGRAVVIKRYTSKDALRFLRRALKRTRARNAWLSGWLLAYAGIDSPRPLCLLEHRRAGLHTQSWLVTAAVDGEPLQAAHAEAQPALFDAVPAVIRVLARAGISHGDMKATNFMACGGRVALIDLDALRWHHSAHGARRALRRDVDRFLRNWRDRPALQKQFAQRLQPWC